MSDIAFVTTGDRRVVPPATARSGRGSGVAPPQPQPPRASRWPDQSAMYGAYAQALVGDASRVLRATDVSQATTLLQAISGPVQNVYFIGHGTPYAFSVNVANPADYDATPSVTGDSQMLVSPVIERPGVSPTLTRGSHLGFLQQLANVLARSAAGVRHVVSFRCCYAFPAYPFHIGLALGHTQRGLRAEIQAYQDYYTVVAINDRAWESRIEQPTGAPPNVTWRRISRASGTHAPPPQLFACLRDGAVSESPCGG